jgi:hypothetical protein
LIHAVVGGATVPTLKTALADAEMLKTVMFTATASASGGIPHGAPMRVTVRGVACSSSESLRESYCRHGATATNGRGFDGN